MKEESDKKELVIKISHLGELLIWLLVVLIIVASFSLWHLKTSKYTNNDYQIFLPDADGLIVGSPVRMMGIQVGHVTKIKPLKDEVYVKFIITNSNVYIPKGSEISVEFSGMAGSKSLELYLPEKRNQYSETNDQLITVLPTKRLNDALGLFNTMYKKFMSIIYTTSSFNKKIKGIDLPIKNHGDLKEFIIYTDNMLDESIEHTENFGEKLERWTKNVRK